MLQVVLLMVAHHFHIKLGQMAAVMLLVVKSVLIPLKWKATRKLRLEKRNKYAARLTHPPIHQARIMRSLHRLLEWKRKPGRNSMRIEYHHKIKINDCILSTKIRKHKSNHPPANYLTKKPEREFWQGFLFFFN